MRVVLVPQGTHGDARPLVALGGELRKAGHHVVFGASPDHCEWIERLGFTCRPVGSFMQAPSDEADRSVGNPFRVLWNGIKFVVKLVPSQFAALDELLEGADLVVGSGLEFAGRTLAERRNIPYCFVCHAPTAVRSRFHPPVAIPYRVLPSWVNRLLWWSNSMGMRLSFGLSIQSQRRRRGMRDVTNWAEFFASHVVVSADDVLAPLPSDCQVEFRTGYFALEDPRPLPDELEAFLGSGSAPVYLGFGSMADPSPKRTLRMLDEFSHERRFVVCNHRARALRSGQMPHVHWVEDVSHHRLFERVTAVVHHGGAGTTHTAARAGVPQVVVPHLVDQYYWAHRVQQLGIGPEALHLRRLSALELGAALDRVAPGSVIQRRAAAFADELREPSQDAARKMVQYLESRLCGARTPAPLK